MQPKISAPTSELLGQGGIGSIQGEAGQHLVKMILSQKFQNGGEHEFGGSGRNWKHTRGSWVTCRQNDFVSEVPEWGRARVWRVREELEAYKGKLGECRQYDFVSEVSEWGKTRVCRQNVHHQPSPSPGTPLACKDGALTILTCFSCTTTCRAETLNRLHTTTG